MKELKYFVISLLAMIIGFVIWCVVAGKPIEPTTISDTIPESEIIPDKEESEIVVCEESANYTEFESVEESTEYAEQEEWTTVIATAYCSCKKCCGVWAENRPNGIVYTASGEEAKQGVTIAADWNVFPKGTVLYIDGMGERIVHDKGGAIKGNRIDVYFEDHNEAWNFGRQELKVKVVV